MLQVIVATVINFYNRISRYEVSLAGTSLFSIDSIINQNQTHLYKPIVIQILKYNIRLIRKLTRRMVQNRIRQLVIVSANFVCSGYPIPTLATIGDVR
jgi:hypothetical protein